jgi:hypothetical protein
MSTQRLIIEVEEDEPYQAFWTDTYGVEYESPEKFLYDLIEEFKTAKPPNYDVSFMGISFSREHFSRQHGLCGVEVFTVDEWFERKLKK